MSNSKTPPTLPDVLDEALDEFYYETVNRPVKGIDEHNTDELDIIMSHKRAIEAEAKQAIITAVCQFVVDNKPQLPASMALLDDFGVQMYKTAADEYEAYLLTALGEGEKS